MEEINETNGTLKFCGHQLKFYKINRNLYILLSSLMSMIRKTEKTRRTWIYNNSNFIHTFSCESKAEKFVLWSNALDFLNDEPIYPFETEINKLNNIQYSQSEPKKKEISKEKIQKSWNYLYMNVLGDKSNEEDFINNLELFLIQNYTFVIKAILKNTTFLQHLIKTFYYTKLKDVVDKAIGISQVIFHINNSGIKELQKIFEDVEKITGISIIHNSKPNINIFGVEVITNLSVALKFDNIVGWLEKMKIGNLFTGMN